MAGPHLNPWACGRPSALRASAGGRSAAGRCAALVCSRAPCVVSRRCCATSCSVCLGAPPVAYFWACGHLCAPCAPFQCTPARVATWCPLAAPGTPSCRTPPAFVLQEGIYEYMFRGDAYSAARILLREFPPLALDGDAVALLLNDNSVFVTGLRNAPAVARLRRMALFLPPTLAGSDYPSPKVLHLRDADGGRRWRALPAAVGGGPEAPRAVLCAQCQSAPGHSTCARCKVVYYCSAECQKRHWKTHKAVCKSAGR